MVSVSRTEYLVSPWCFTESKRICLFTYILLDKQFCAKGITFVVWQSEIPTVNLNAVVETSHISQCSQRISYKLFVNVDSMIKLTKSRKFSETFTKQECAYNCLKRKWTQTLVPRTHKTTA